MFVCVLPHIPFGECPFIYFAFFQSGCFLLTGEFWGFFISFRKESLVICVICSFIFQYFYLLNRVVYNIKVFRFKDVQLTRFFSFMDHAFWSCLKTLHQTPVSKDFLFYSKSFIFTLNIIHFVLYLHMMWGLAGLDWVRLVYDRVFVCFLLMVYEAKTIFSPLNCFCTFVKNQVAILVYF